MNCQGWLLSEAPKRFFRKLDFQKGDDWSCETVKLHSVPVKFQQNCSNIFDRFILFTPFDKWADLPCASPSSYFLRTMRMSGQIEPSNPLKGKYRNFRSLSVRCNTNIFHLLSTWIITRTCHKAYQQVWLWMTMVIFYWSVNFAKSWNP